MSITHDTEGNTQPRGSALEIGVRAAPSWRERGEGRGREGKEGGGRVKEGGREGEEGRDGKEGGKGCIKSEFRWLPATHPCVTTLFRDSRRKLKLLERKYP